MSSQPLAEIVVFGSINMDLVVRTPRLPAPGETLRGLDFLTTPGGKGANQAAACARLGLKTALIGQVGDDGFGVSLRAGLQTIGVDVDDVMAIPGPSGVAVIAVDQQAENSIILIPGANARVGTEELARLKTRFKAASPGKGATCLLLQLEIPLKAVLSAARLAREHHVRVILDPAPACLLPEELYSLTDVLTPNETECATLVGFEVMQPSQASQGDGYDPLARMERAAKILLERGAKQVVIKLGASGAYLHDGAAGEWIPGLRVQAVDTTAAGDAFNGALASALVRGCDLRSAVRFANAAGALSTTRKGAQSCMPSLAEVQQFHSLQGD